MEDKTITGLSFLLAIAGIAGLWAVSTILKPEAVRIADIDASDSGKIVKIDGVLVSVIERDGNYFLKVSDGAEIRAVIFKGATGRVPASSLANGSAVSLTGQVMLYRGEPEILVQSLNALSR